MLSAWFANPVLLWTLLALPMAQVLLLFALFRSRRLTAQLANPLLLRKSLLLRPHVRRWKNVCIVMGILLVALAATGPQWGIDRDAQVRKGRDVILVLDMSRSMDAEQPSRRELAVRSLFELADSFEEHGGNRIAMIAFASQPQLLFPLTQDCDHLRLTLKRVEEDDVPKLSAEDPKSGTRMGEALKLALDSYDPARANRPIIVLLSDGDDPVDDNEWLAGVTAAQEKRVSIHVVGLGDPLKEETIPAGNDVLRFNGAPVKTKLNEKRLRDIAEQTGGSYLPAHTSALPLGTFVLHLLDADELREETPSDDMLPIYQLRYAWFLLPAVLLFMLAIWLNEGPRQMTVEKKAQRPVARSHPRRSKAAALAVVAVALLSVSAADPPAADGFLRQANEAFEREDYAAAIKLYEQAEALTLDPGQVSFNKAAAHFRLKQHKEAIECYRRCLQDDSGPSERRARAHFDLGNALVELACIDPYRLTASIGGASVSIGLNRQHPGDNPTILAEAIAEYRACLHRPDLPARLRTDARYNLELAQLLWLKAREGSPEATRPSEDPIYPDNQKSDNQKYADVDPSKDPKTQEDGNAPEAKKSKQVPSAGIPMNLPNDNRLQPMSPEDTLATLAKHARRIAEERRAHNNPRVHGPLTTKDW